MAQEPNVNERGQEEKESIPEARESLQAIGRDPGENR